MVLAPYLADAGPSVVLRVRLAGAAPGLATVTEMTPFPAWMHITPGGQRLSSTTAPNVSANPAPDTDTDSPTWMVKVSPRATVRAPGAAVVGGVVGVVPGTRVVAGAGRVVVGLATVVTGWFVDDVVLVTVTWVVSGGGLVDRVATDDPSPPHAAPRATIVATARAVDNRCKAPPPAAQRPPIPRRYQQGFPYGRSANLGR